MIKLFLNSIFLSLIAVSSVMANDYESVDKLKTLFTTSSERSKLDEMRRSGNFSKKQTDAGVSISIEPKKVTVRGLMMRENGEPVVWVNEGSTLKSSRIDNDIKVNTQRIKSGVKIPVNVNQRRLTMKPGQEWTESGNKIKDSYQTK